MQRLNRLACGILLLSLCGAEPPSRAEPATAGATFEIAAVTQPAPGRRAVIAPLPELPVAAVLVAAGDRVTKGQVLLRLDTGKAAAEVRAKEADREADRATAGEARREQAGIEQRYRAGGVSEPDYHEACRALLAAEANERAALVALDAARTRQEHCTVRAPLDGVVSRLDVCVGTVTRAGAPPLGEILDLRELDARCEVTPNLADRLSAGQYAEVRRAGDGESDFTPARVASVGVAEDPHTGLVPVLVRVENPVGKFRSGVPVRVRFGGAAVAGGR